MYEEFVHEAEAQQGKVREGGGTLVNELVVILIGLWIIVLVLMEISHRRLNNRRNQWKYTFAEAFKEWAESCDWLGYDEIPAEMYWDLERRLANALNG